MKVERFSQLDPKHYRRVRCEEIVIVYPHALYKVDRRCKSSAQYKINDIPYCERHAGKKCLEHLMKEEVK